MPTEDSRTTQPPTLLTTRQAAEVLGFEPRTMEELRRRGSGPPFIRLSSRSVRYRLDDLEQWLDERTFRSTAQERGGKAGTSRAGAALREPDRGSDVPGRSG